MMFLSFIACGPSQKEREKQKKAEDSIATKESNNAVDNANKILSDTSIKAKETKPEKGTKKGKS